MSELDPKILYEVPLNTGAFYFIVNVTRICKKTVWIDKPWDKKLEKLNPDNKYGAYALGPANIYFADYGRALLYIKDRKGEREKQKEAETLIIDENPKAEFHPSIEELLDNIEGHERYLKLLKDIFERGVDDESAVEVMAVHNLTGQSVQKLCGVAEKDVLATLIESYLSNRETIVALGEQIKVLRAENASLRALATSIGDDKNDPTGT